MNIHEQTNRLQHSLTKTDRPNLINVFKYISGSSGQITEKHRSILIQCQPKLNENVKYPDEIARILRSKCVFIDREVDDVQVAKTSADKIEWLVDLIKKSDDRAFYGFIEALKETNNKSLANDLENEDRSRNKRKRRAPDVPGKKYYR